MCQLFFYYYYFASVSSNSVVLVQWKWKMNVVNALLSSVFSVQCIAPCYKYCWNEMTTDALQRVSAFFLVPRCPLNREKSSMGVRELELWQKTENKVRWHISIVQVADRRPMGAQGLVEGGKEMGRIWHDLAEWPSLVGISALGLGQPRTRVALGTSCVWGVWFLLAQHPIATWQWSWHHGWGKVRVS